MNESDVRMGVGMVLKVGRLKASSMSRRRRRTEISKVSRGFPSPQQGGVGNFLEIYVRIGAFWSANHC